MTNEMLTIVRFRALADAYGGTIARWPADVRDAAALLATDPEARAILAEAEALDTALDAWTMPPPPSALRDRVLSVRAAEHRRPSRRLRLWWSGIGVASALAGAAAGTVAAAAAAPKDAGIETATAFGDPGGQED